MDWHPFAMRFGLIEDWSEFLESIKVSGGNRFPVLYRVLPGGKKQGIDGRNRWLACKELGLPCKMEEVKLADDDVIDFILDANHNRRHHSQAQRKEIVGDLRYEGWSSRKIAAAVGVDESTVRRDLASGAANAAPAASGGGAANAAGAASRRNGTVTGRDGKTYSARKPKLELMCSRCRRVGAVAGCGDCRRARQDAKKRAADRKAAQANAPSERLDNYGNILPKRCLDLFDDPWIEQVAAKLSEIENAFTKARFQDGIHKRQAKFPFIKAEAWAKLAGEVQHGLTQLMVDILAGQPRARCRGCEGKGCGACGQTGLVSIDGYEEQKRKERS